MRLIQVNANQVDRESSDRFQGCNLCVGGGRAYETLLNENQRQLRTVHEECGFRYLRFHGLFHDDMGVYQETREGTPFYNWQYIDLLYDTMLRLGVRPFVELSFTPSKLASGNKTIFFWRGNVTMPKSLEKWEDLIRAFTQHVTERYGQEEVKKWFFEVWNEPNLYGFFASDTPFEDYLRLYEASARAIKSVCPQYRVGGPATAGCAWVPEFIRACANAHLPLDFITTHTYGVEGFVDEFGENLQRLIPDETSVSGDMRRVRQQIDQSCMPQLPLYFTEWSSSYSSRDNAHDSYHEAAFVLTRIKDAFRYVDGMSYWTFSDIFEEAGPGPAPFHGGFGLMNVKGLKKPAFFAYQFLHRLGDSLLSCDDRHSLCARDGCGVQVLFWDYTIPQQSEAEANQHYFVRDLPAKPVSDACIQVEGLEPGTYLLELFGVGYRMNDVYTLYHDLGCPADLTPVQEQYLRESCEGAPLLRQTVKIDGTFSFQREMHENDVYFLKLTKF